MGNESEGENLRSVRAYVQESPEGEIGEKKTLLICDSCAWHAAYIYKTKNLQIPEDVVVLCPLCTHGRIWTTSMA